MYALLIILAFAAPTKLQEDPAPNKTTTFQNYKFEIFEIPRDYNEAKSVCLNRNAWLTEIKSDETRAAVQLMTRSTTWIGLHYDHGWKWNNIESLHYKNWFNRYYPLTVSSRFNNYCVRMTDGKWANENCSLPFAFICQSDPKWILFDNVLTLDIVKNNVTTFHGARSQCSSLGKSLISIKTEALDKFITKQLSNESESFWTSGNDIDFEGNWKWEDGTLITDAYQNWKQHTFVRSEPNGRRNENCLLKYSGMGFRWVDTECTLLFGYICEKDVSSGICGSDICSNRGICKISGKRYKCNCTTAGYSGTKCDLETDPCNPTPCKNGATCQNTDVWPFYTCICQPSYRGKLCQERRFTVYDGCKYHINLYDTREFMEANTTCTNLGGSVAMLKTKQILDVVENQIIDQYSSFGSVINFWIGAYKRNHDWLWLDGSRVNYRNWAWSSVETGSGYLFMSSFASTRENMKFINNEDGFKIQGYICEVPAINRCEPSPCLNSGTCIKVGCQSSCKCASGFEGSYCELETVSTFKCSGSSISIHWRRSVFGKQFVYGLENRDSRTGESKQTNVRLLLPEKANMHTVQIPSNICVTRTVVSSANMKDIVIEQTAGRIRNKLKIISKVIYNLKTRVLRLTFVDFA